MSNERVAVFIDLPNITYSFENEYNAELDPQLLVDKAKRYGAVAVIKAFADFTEPGMKRMHPRLKAAGIDIEWCPASVRADGTRKDYVDFTMLEHIYQTHIDDPDVDTYILMTGDGHFSGVAGKFRNRLDKRVVVCAVPGTISGQLIESASRHDELIVEVEEPNVNIGDLIRHISWGEENLAVTTFNGIRTSFRDRTNVDPQRALSDLVDEGLLVQETTELDGQEVRETRLNREHPRVKKILSELRM
jgi:hypothetical protein